jgi:hypothetical protein
VCGIACPCYLSSTVQDFNSLSCNPMPARIANIAISSVISMIKNLSKQLLLLQLPVPFSASSRP